MQLSFFTPEPTWKPLRVSEFPDLRHEKIIAFDTETYDPNLAVKGPGFLRGDAYVCGISIAVPGWSTYLPIRHYDGNVDDPAQAIAWTKAMLAGSAIKLGANIHYDLDAVKTLGIAVNGALYDVQTIDALIDEDQPSFSLDSIAIRRLGRGKDDALLKSVLNDSRLTMSGMPMLSAGHVAEYAIRDANLLLGIAESQRRDILLLELERASEREQALTRVLWKMHQKGIRVNIAKAEQLNLQLKEQARDHLMEAQRNCALRIFPDSPKSLAKVAEYLGFHPPRTAKGNASVTNEWLKATGNPVLEQIYEYRRINKIRRDFVEGLFLDYAINGRIHPQWFQSRHTTEGEDDGIGGASTGRITGAKPNLTQIPGRDPILGPLTRSLVLPEEDSIYCKADFSSQEPRWTLHYAVKLGAPGAAEAQQMFLNDKRTDFHQMTRDMVEERSGRSINRRDAKDINLGLTYGMQERKLAAKLGLELDTARELFAIYHQAVPFIKKTAEKAFEIASQKQVIRTWGGRLRRFKKWESRSWGDKGLFDSYEECMEIHGSARVAGLHKALNAAVQGTAADQMKQAIINCDAYGDLPILQVYDECGFSVESEQHGQNLCEVMEEALPGEIPALVEPAFGPSWGECE